MPTGIYERKNRRPLRDVICRHCGVSFQTYRRKLQTCEECCGIAWNKGLELPTACKERISQTLKNRREKPIPHSIYYLLDPRTGGPRYVGFSENPQKRLLTHLADPLDTHKCRWLASLRLIGLLPVMSVRCIVQGALEAGRVEIALIAALRAKGIDLTNTTRGGDGFVGGKWSAENRRKHKEHWETIGRHRPNPQKGRPQTAQHIEATKAANTPELLARRGASIKAGWARRNGAPTTRIRPRPKFENGYHLTRIPNAQVPTDERLRRQLDRAERKLARLKAEIVLDNPFSNIIE